MSDVTKQAAEWLASDKPVTAADQRIADLEREWPEHPDDKAMRLECERKSKKYGPALAATKTSELIKLLTIYADSEAVELLEKLREWYWGGALDAETRKHEPPTGDEG